MKYTKINLKPISVNNAWQGKRFKTKEYIDYEKSCILMLPDLDIPKGELEISIIYGFSNNQSDIDNPTKLVLDILQKRYGFNDKMIYELRLRKEIVKKGEEYFEFKISKY